MVNLSSRVYLLVWKMIFILDVMNCGLYLPLVHRRFRSHETLFSPAFRKNRRPTCEVELKSTSQACRRQRRARAMVVVADGVCSHMSEQYPRLYWWLCRR